MKTKHLVPSFGTYVPVGVSRAARNMFRVCTKVVLRKFADAEKKHSWNDAWRTTKEDYIQDAFYEHVAKGDPRDVVIFCFIMMFHNWKIKPRTRDALRRFVIFDGPPSNDSPKFVEVEDVDGRSRGDVVWQKRPDGLYSLGPFYVDGFERKEIGHGG